MKPNINTLQSLLTTRTKAALLVVLYSTFLMSLTSFAGTRDTVAAKKDSCCTTRSIAKAASTPVTVKRTIAAETPANNTDPNAAPEMTQTLAVALQQQLVNADDETNYHFMAGYFQKQASSASAACDAFTDVQVAVKNISRLSVPAPANADRSIDKVFKAEYILNAGVLPIDDSVKLFIGSDKAINQHFAAQYGTVVAL